MKKIYIALAVLATALLSSCVQEKSFKDIVVGENELAFVMEGASTRAAEGNAPQAAKGITIPMGVINGEGLYLEETIQELNPSPATRGVPVYNENLGIMHKTLGVYGEYEKFGDAIFQGMDEAIHNGGWRYNHNYDGSPWPDKKTPVNFYLRLPATPAGLTFTKREGKVTEFTLVSPLSGEDQEDVVLGQVSISKETHDKALPEGYVVEMQHALTGIKFANAHPNTNPTKTIITKVEIIGLYGKGDCSIDAEGNITWDSSKLSTPSTADAPFYLEFDNPTYVAEDGANNPDGTVGTSGDKQWASNFGSTWTSAAADKNLNEPDGSLTFWFIPQEISDDVILKVYFTVKTPDSVDGFLTDACHTIHLGAMLNERYQEVHEGENLKWEAGQLRTYTLAPYDVDVDIKDQMTSSTGGTDLDTKSGLHIANTGNVDEYVRMLIMGNWYGWMPGEDHSKVDPHILVGYMYKDKNDPNLPTGLTDAEKEVYLKKMVLPWYREGYPVKNGVYYATEAEAIENGWVKGTDGYGDPYGQFDSDFALANLGDRDGAWEDWADASGGYYYTTPIGPGDGTGIGDAVQSATKDLFESYQVTNKPTIYLATSATTRVAAEDVHLRMEIVVQAIAVPKDKDGNPVWWLEAWYEATHIDKLSPDYTSSSGKTPNKKYKDLFTANEYPGMSAGPGI